MNEENRGRIAKSIRVAEFEGLKVDDAESVFTPRHPLSRISYLASRIPHPASRIPYTASRIPDPGSRIPYLVSRIPRAEKGSFRILRYFTDG